MAYGAGTLHTDYIRFFPCLNGWSEEAHEAGRKDRACNCMLEEFEASSFSRPFFVIP